MNKKIILGSFLAVIIMLMIPINSAVESDVVEKNQILIKKDLFIKRFFILLDFFLLKIKDTHPDFYSEINQEINDYMIFENDSILCIIIGLIFLFFEVLIFFNPYLFGIIAFPMCWIMLKLAEFLKCEWAP